jgi:hypothetical protein
MLTPSQRLDVDHQQTFPKTFITITITITIQRQEIADAHEPCRELPLELSHDFDIRNHIPR